ncbi:Hypothetical predicted protein, partial [Paramuricea clavata]
MKKLREVIVLHVVPCMKYVREYSLYSQQFRISGTFQLSGKVGAMAICGETRLYFFQARRDLLTETKFVELILVNDYGQFRNEICLLVLMRDCQFIARGTACRDAVNLCDVPEFCNGTSEVCPADLVTVNGLSCNNDRGYCHEGECRTYDEQCNELWVESAFKADDRCYATINLRNDVHGYCKRTSRTTYMACAPENVQCGTLNSGAITCWSAQIYQAPGLLERATVLDGTKCGSEMVCQNNECMSLSVVYAGQPTCANNCSGNGVCNEN